MIGIGGGGDVVGALATAEAARIYDHARPVLGGLSWERRPVDPLPGPRAAAEIEGAETIAPGVLLAGPRTRVRASGVRFAESRMAEFLGEPTVLVDVNPGPATVAAGLAAAAQQLGCDLIVMIDVGGDVLAAGDEAGLRSPLADAVMLAAAGELVRGGRRVMLGVFGAGCDGELTPNEVMGRISEVAAAGGLLGVRGLTEPVARRLEEATKFVITEASAQAVRAFRGACGEAAIRGGATRVQLGPVAAMTFYLDVERTLSSVGRLAAAVAGARDLEAANLALRELGVRSELDLEQDSVPPLSEPG